MNNITRRRSITAAQLRDGMLLDFDDEQPGIVSDVKHLAHKILFMARGTQFALDRDEHVMLVIRMQLVEG